MTDWVEHRDEAEVEELYEEIYQAHWEIRDAQIHDRPAPEEYISGRTGQDSLGIIIGEDGHRTACLLKCHLPW